MRHQCYVTFRITDGDREMCVSLYASIPEFMLAIGNSLNWCDELNIGSEIRRLSWYASDETIDVEMMELSVPADAFDAMYVRLDGHEMIDFLEISRGDSVIDFVPASPIAAE